jgi:hypothetical protein
VRATAPSTAPPDADHVASTDAEARWNYAFWLQSPAARSPDPEKTALLDRQVEVSRQSGHWYEDEDEEEARNGVWEKMDLLDEMFWGMFSRCVRRLHDEGEITRRFGRAIPVIVHCLEYGDQQERHTNAANPAELLTEFNRTWIADL